MEQIPRYIKSKKNPKTIKYKHPLLKNILDVTYGCMVYQEQVMQVAQVIGGYTLGGEQSGHVINREFATTGDGTLTALTLCNEVVKSGKSLKELAADFPQLPQTLINVPNVDKMAAKTNAKVQAELPKVLALGEPEAV